MVTAFITFLSSSAGGALLGFVLDWLDRKHEYQMKKEDRKLRGRMAELKAIEEHTKQLDATTPGTLKEIKTKWTLWGVGYESRKWKVFKTNVSSPRAIVVALCLGLLTFTYCYVLIVFAVESQDVIWTYQPDPKPRKFGFLFWSYEWQRDSIYELTKGGIAYLMAHPLIFILSTAIVGTTRKLGK
jgi:hypothetical protein